MEKLFDVDFFFFYSEDNIQKIKIKNIEGGSSKKEKSFKNI